MPEYQTGDMWSALDNSDLFLITTNSFVRADGRLVMGRGIARQAAGRYPLLPRAFGRMLQEQELHLGEYGLLTTEVASRRFGAFQTKRHWRDPSDFDLIKMSIEKLLEFLAEHDFHAVHLNFPGIGYGGLEREEVLPLLTPLPSFVSIWEFGI